MDDQIERLVSKEKKRIAALSPFEQMVERARQKRSYVVSELMWGTDEDEAAGRDAMTREQAEAIYDTTADGALLKELERKLETE